MQLYALLMYCVGQCVAGSFQGHDFPAPVPPEGLLLFTSLEHCEAKAKELQTFQQLSDGTPAPYQYKNHCSRIYLAEKL